MIGKKDNEKFVKHLLDNGVSLEEAIYWIKTYLYPEDVFDKGSLVNWSLDNGFMEEDSLCITK